MTPKKPEPKEPEIVRTTIRVPRHLWEAILHHAIAERTSAQEIVNSALRAYLKANRKK